ncbi:glycosyltransferase family 4 protein [Desulfovibrio gilichinskyi]|uniref:glycosyltransferase family 4 protein n=1 Tax=Desulfovibrio gilichinskyi TaxID=1519643 RepID=UPI0014836904|nr:glycosyltransferase family 4 protein [Desulfovibrio gilichinskyi]
MNSSLIKVLIISRDLDHQGGVVDTVKMLMTNLDESFEATHFAFGRKAGQGLFSGYLQPFFDVFSLAYFLLRNKFDVFHVNPSLNGRAFLRESLVLLLLKIFGYSGRVLVFFHGWTVSFFEQITSNSIYNSIFKWLLSVAGKITVLSSKYEKSLISCGISKGRVEVVSSMFSKNDVPESVDLNVSQPTLLFLSRMVRKKGVYELLDAIEILTAKYPAIKLIFAGDGPERRNLEAESVSRGLSNISFPGFIRGTDKKSALAKSDIFILPTLFSEGCPVSLLESMGAGLACVVPLSGGIEDVVHAGLDAVILPEITVAAIVNAVTYLLESPEIFKAVSLEARQNALRHYEAGIVSMRISSIYKDLAKAGVN